MAYLKIQLHIDKAIKLVLFMNGISVMSFVEKKNTCNASGHSFKNDILKHSLCRSFQNIHLVMVRYNFSLKLFGQPAFLSHIQLEASFFSFM